MKLTLGEKAFKAILFGQNRDINQIAVAGVIQQKFIAPLEHITLLYERGFNRQSCCQNRVFDVSNC